MRDGIGTSPMLQLSSSADTACDGSQGAPRDGCPAGARIPRRRRRERVKGLQSRRKAPPFPPPSTLPGAHSEGRTVEREGILTPTGYEKLKNDIERLQTVERRKVAERIREAREFGDISENSEYDDAKNEQARLESRIHQLQEKLRSARVIDTSDIPTDVVAIGSRVKDRKSVV